MNVQHILVAISVLSTIATLGQGSNGKAQSIPYDIVILDRTDVLDRNDTPEIIQISLQTGTTTRIPIELPPEPWGLIATGQNTIYVLSVLGLDNRIGRYDISTKEWSTLFSPFTPIEPRDLEVAPNGRLLVSGESGITSLDLTTLSGGTLVSGEDPRGVEVRSDGTFIWSDLIQPPGPGNEPLSTIKGRGISDIETNIWIGAFSLETETTLIATGRGENKLYRINLETKGIDVIFEDDRLSGGNLAIAPDGLVVTNVNGANGRQGKLLTIDLETGITSEFELDTSTAGDFDVLIVPEPRNIALFSVGLLALATHGGLHKRLICSRTSHSS